VSRARYIELPGGEIFWFDTSRNGEKAEAALADSQLEMLAALEAVDIDQLLESEITQGEMVDRLRKAFGQYTAPDAIIERRDALRKERSKQPECRSCGATGNSTKHHFVNKWMLKELSHYAQRWADRKKNCIPLCITCHREIHRRDMGVHSIAGMLTETERKFAWRALDAFSDQHPSIAMTMLKGDSSVYEAQLMKDFIQGNFGEKPEDEN
jgi:hypothetical protein